MGTLPLAASASSGRFAPKWKVLISVIFGIFMVILDTTVVNVAFLVSNTYKIPHGGYWSIIIAAIPFSIIMLYRTGQRRLYYALQPLPMDVFLLSYNQIYRSMTKIKGTALFFARDAKEMPPYIVHTMFKNNILYEDNIFLSIIKRDDPYGVAGFQKEDLAPGLRVFEIQMGYMEVIDVEEILREAGIEERVVFYGLEADLIDSLFISFLAGNLAGIQQLLNRGIHGAHPMRATRLLAVAGITAAMKGRGAHLAGSGLIVLLSGFGGFVAAPLLDKLKTYDWGSVDAFKEAMGRGPLANEKVYGLKLRLVDAPRPGEPHIELLQGHDVGIALGNQPGHAGRRDPAVHADATVDVVGEDPQRVAPRPAVMPHRHAHHRPA